MNSDVKLGSIWADGDSRMAGRTLRVDRIDGDRVLCAILTNTTDAQSRIDAGDAWTHDRRGKTVSIAHRRFDESSRGYKLVTPAPDLFGDAR